MYAGTPAWIKQGTIDYITPQMNQTKETTVFIDKTARAKSGYTHSINSMSEAGVESKDAHAVKE